jgi:hypothetical protein
MQGAASSLVALPGSGIDRLPDAVGDPATAWKAAINGVSTQSGIFTKNLRWRPIVWRFAS